MAPSCTPRHDEQGTEKDVGLQRYDKPQEAQEFFAAKRLPAGAAALPIERYLEAKASMQNMRGYSTRFAKILPSRRDIGSSGLDKSGLLQGWEELGPGNVGGRTRSLLVHPTEPETLYAAGVAGGVWKTLDGGASWAALDDLMPHLAVSSLAMDPTDSGTIYAGTGEGFFNGDAVRGAGIFKTADAGSTWTHLASTDTDDFQYVNDIVVSHRDPQRLYAATHTGIWRSTDGGTSWSGIFGPAPMLHVLDLALRTDLASQDRLIASVGFQNGGVVLSVDASAGQPGWNLVLFDETIDAGLGRTALAIAPSDQDVVYALASSLDPGPDVTGDSEGDFKNGFYKLYRSADGGLTWAVQLDRGRHPDRLLGTNSYPALCPLPNERRYVNQAGYDWVISVDPTDADVVWVGGIDLFRSDDGGATFGLSSRWFVPKNWTDYAHADQHAIVFHPGYDGANNRSMFVGNDGGLFKTTDATSSTIPIASVCDVQGSVPGIAWSSLNNGYAVTQFYHGTVYPDGATYFGGTQDNGTNRGTDGNGPDGWAEIFGGDGGFSAVDPDDTNVVFASTQRGRIHRSVNGGGDFSNVFDPSGEPTPDETLFIAPFVMDPNDSARLWTGGRFLWRTENSASSWARASLQLGTDSNCNGKVSAIAVAPENSDAVLVGLSDGCILRSTTATTDDGNSAWSSVRPQESYVSSLTFDPANINVAYATFANFGAIHVMRSGDGGATWSPLEGSGADQLPDLPTHSLAVDPENSSRLFVGTDLGVFASTDSGATWMVENTGFANVITEWLTMNTREGEPSALYAFTHGRGAWRVPLGTFDLSVSLEGDGSGSVSSNPPGIDCGIDCHEGYTAGTVVTLTASPDPGSTFTGWSGACADTASCVVTMNQDLSVSATFSFSSADLSLNLVDVPFGTFAPGDPITIRNTTENVGGQGSSIYRITFYASSNTFISPSDLSLGFVNRSSLEPGAVHDFNTTATLPASIAFGSYYIGAILTVSDADPSNNTNYDPTPIHLESPIFADGFESGDTTQWSSSTQQ